MNIDYCYKECRVGKQAAQDLLAQSESVSDAVIDFWHFVEECFVSCPHKDEHIKYIVEEN